MRHACPTVRPYRDDDFEEVVVVWHRSMSRACTYLPGHTLDEDRAYFRTSIVPHCRIAVCSDGEVIVGFLAMKGGYLDRLYVDPDHQRRGVGTALLAEAIRSSPHEIRLHTHQQNHGACAFYEKHGFRAVAFGLSPPPESVPDVEYLWRPGERAHG